MNTSEKSNDRLERKYDEKGKYLSNIKKTETFGRYRNIKKRKEKIYRVSQK
jgi:hypothetical protein